MLSVVMQTEWRNLRRERWFWLVIGAFALAVGFASLESGRLVRGERARAEAIAEQDARRLAALAVEAEAIIEGNATAGQADPTSPLAVGRELLPRAAQLPHAPLAPLAVGQRDVLPQTVMLTTRTRSTHASEGETLSAGQRASGPFDLSFVLVFLLPLVIIAATFDLLSGERERGTLALVLSQPLSLSTFVMGKAGVRLAILAAVTIVLVLAGVLLAGARFGSDGALGALGLSLALLVGYTLFWVALALAVNAWGRSSAANALALVGVWLGLTIIVPGLAGILVETVHPPPSRVELVNRTREAARDASTRASALEGDHGKPTSEASTRAALATQAELERQLAPVLVDFEARLAAQQGLVDKLRFASPALLVHEGLSDLAGSSVTRHQHFSKQVAAYQRELQTYFHERAEAGQRLAAVDYAEVPRFAYVEVATGALAARVVAAVVALLTAALALLALARAGLRTHVSRGLR
jgi:ABC-2 type transport system permease protein